MSSTLDSLQWTAVCTHDDVIPNTGAAVKVGGAQVALFRLRSHAGDEWYAVSNTCPFAKAQVLSRGIIGSHGETPTVASPIYKQRFDLRDGQCLDNEEVSLRTWPVRLHDGQVLIGTAAQDGPE